MKLIPSVIILMSTNAFAIYTPIVREGQAVHNEKIELGAQNIYGTSNSPTISGVGPGSYPLDTSEHAIVSIFNHGIVNNATVTGYGELNAFDGGTINDSVFSGNASTSITRGASSTNLMLSDSAGQYVYGTGSIAENNTLTDKTSQWVHAGGSAANTMLSGSAQQKISGTGSIAENNTLTDNTVQKVWDTAKVINTTLSGSAVQSISGGASAMENMLSGSAQQQISGTDSIAENNTLTDNTVQKVWDTAKVINTTLSGSAVQSISGGASAMENMLSGSAQQQISGTGSIAENNTLTDKTSQWVHAGGSAANTMLSGSAQQKISGTGSIAENNTLTDNTVQKVWDTAKVINTTLSGSAVQSISGGASAMENMLSGSAQQQISGTGSIAENNTLTDNTVQKVWDTAKVINTTLSDNAVQHVSGTGSVSENNTFTDGAIQKIYSGGLTLGSILNGYSQQWITGDGDIDPAAVSKNTIINDISAQILFDNSHAENTTVNDNGTVIINGNNALSSNTQLNSGNVHIIKGSAHDTTVESNGVLTLEQHGNLHGDTILNGGQLVINGADVHIGGNADFISANNNALIQVNGANNTLSNLALNEGYVTLTDPFARTESTAQYKQLNIGNLTGQGTFLLSVDLATPQGDFVQIQNASGNHGVLVKSSGRNPLSANALDIIAAKEGDATFQLKNKGQVVDLGTYQYYLTNSSATGQTVWSLTANPNNGDNGDNGDNGGNGGGSISPSTDAVLSMVSATQFIADGEMQSLRFRHGDLRNNAGSNAGVWGRFLLNDTRIHAAEGASYELKQNGMEFGADNVIELANGKLALGGLAVFSNNRLEHSRGGQSSIKSYGIGGYATYFNDSGYYVDTVLKYNRFNDTLNAVMTDGVSTTGSYSQNALTTSIETGFNYSLSDIVWVEPYIRGTYFVTDSQNFTLDNGMQAHTGVTRSARVELGSSLGVNYTIGDKNIRPYVRAALENEFIKSNNVTVNETDEFNNDFSGIVGKYGIGISANVSDKASVYAEANYRKGHNIESPIVANLGFRINF